MGIFGTYSDSSSNDVASYLTKTPYEKFQRIADPGAQATIVTAVAAREVAAVVFNPPQLPGIWSFVRIDGAWELVKSRREGMEILGVNDSLIAVGFYLSRSNAMVPFELNLKTNRLRRLHPPNSVSGEAAGINDEDDVVGSFTAPSGGMHGFFLRSGSYHEFSYPSASSTQANGLNARDQVAGQYVDSGGVTHGFILTDPAAPPASRMWQSIDEPNAAALTVVNAIDGRDELCGWYVDGNDAVHGFVATPKRG